MRQWEPIRGSVPLPFQKWRNFKEAFAPELIARAVAESPIEVQRVIDPFGGSGTTALAAQFPGIFPTTIEVNPYLADLIEAKIGKIDPDRAVALPGDLMECVARSDTLTSDPLMIDPGSMTIDPFPGAPDTFVEPGKNGRFIFWRDVAKSNCRIPQCNSGNSGSCRGSVVSCHSRFGYYRGQQRSCQRKRTQVSWRMEEQEGYSR